MCIKAKILIVDDEPDLCELISMYLETEDYEVITASNGVEALATLKEQEVDLVLSDVKMSRGCGLELLNNILATSGKKPFVILCSGDLNFGDENVLAKKAYAVLTKPVDLPSLVELLDKAVGS